MATGQPKNTQSETNFALIERSENMMNMKDNLGQPANRLPELVTQIKKKLNDAFQALKRNLEFYREAGRLLLQAKRELKAYSRQPWKSWVSSPEGPGIHHRVAEFYMRLHRRWEDIQKHPDFNPKMGYPAALKLVRKPKIDRQGKGTVTAPPANGAGQEKPVVSLVQPGSDPIPGEPGLSRPQRTVLPLEDFNGVAEVPADDAGLGSPTPTPVPSPVEDRVTVPAVPNVTARIAGTANLAVTPTDDYSLDYVLELVRKGEATVQEQTDNITLDNATVIGTFKVVNRTYTLTDLTGHTAQAA
jgi:hypothetical protein